jgi:hypothetical protein
MILLGTDRSSWLNSSCPKVAKITINPQFTPAFTRLIPEID